MKSSPRMPTVRFRGTRAAHPLPQTLCAPGPIPPPILSRAGTGLNQN